MQKFSGVWSLHRKHGLLTYSGKNIRRICLFMQGQFPPSMCYNVLITRFQRQFKRTVWLALEWTIALRPEYLLHDMISCHSNRTRGKVLQKVRAQKQRNELGKPEKSLFLIWGERGKEEMGRQAARHSSGLHCWRTFFPFCFFFLRRMRMSLLLTF